MNGMRPSLRENEVLDLMTQGHQASCKHPFFSLREEYPRRTQFTVDHFCIPNSYNPNNPPLTCNLSPEYRWLSTFYWRMIYIQESPLSWVYSSLNSPKVNMFPLPKSRIRASPGSTRPIPVTTPPNITTILTPNNIVTLLVFCTL